MGALCVHQSRPPISTSLSVCFPGMQAMHQAKNRQQLLKLLAKHAEGIPLIELQEAYPAAGADIAASQKDGKLYRLYNPDLDPGRTGIAGWMLFYRWVPELCSLLHRG